MKGSRCTWYQGPTSLTLTVFEADENNFVFTKGVRGFVDSTLWKGLQGIKGKQNKNKPTNPKYTGTAGSHRKVRLRPGLRPAVQRLAHPHCSTMGSHWRVRSCPWMSEGRTSWLSHESFRRPPEVSFPVQLLAVKNKTPALSHRAVPLVPLTYLLSLVTV